MTALTLRTLRRMSVREWSDVAMSAAVATIVEIGLRTVSLPRLARVLGTPWRHGSGVPVAPTEVSGSPVGSRPTLPPRDRAKVRATRRVMRHWPFGDTCLRQALVAGQRLRRLGPTLQVGVAKVDGEVRAHAWLEIDGVILDPMRAASAYQPMTPPGPDGTA